MALYSDIIDTNSKWMWSSITSGSISLLLLTAAFFGFSANMNNPTILIDSDQYRFISTVKTSGKSPSQIANQQADIENAGNNIAMQIKRSSKQNSTFLRIAPTKTVQNIAKSITPLRKQVETTPSKKVATTVKIKSNQTNILAATKPTSIGNAKTLSKQQSNLPRTTIPPTQIAALNLPGNKSNSKQVDTSSKTTLKPFKKVDKSLKVKKGDTLLKILKRNGASSSEAQAIVNQLKPHINIHALEVGQPITITLDRRTNNSNIHPVKIIIPLGFSAKKPSNILKERISIAYGANNKLQVQLPASKSVAVNIRPSKPLKAPKYTPTQPVNKKAAKDLSNKIASLTTSKKSVTGLTKGKGSKVYYRTRSWVKNSFKSTIAAQGVPKDVQARLLSVYNQTAKSKKVKSGDILEVFYDQTETITGKRLKLGKLLYISFKANGKVYTYYRYGSSFYDKYGKSINPPTGKGFMSYPLPGAKLTSKYGMRKHPVTRRWKMHPGTDFAAPRGTPIYAAASGKITMAKWFGGYGRHINITHKNNYTSSYSHMTRYAKGIRKGSNVRKGQIIGYVGTTGLSTGNHLHFMVTKNGKKINPMLVIGRGGGSANLSGANLSKFKKEKARIIGRLNQTKAITKIAKK